MLIAKPALANLLFCGFRRATLCRRTAAKPMSYSPAKPSDIDTKKRTARGNPYFGLGEGVKIAVSLKLWIAQISAQNWNSCGVAIP